MTIPTNLDPRIRINHVHERGCGYRNDAKDFKGRMYLMGDGLSMACGILPIPITCCPHCERAYESYAPSMYNINALLPVEYHCKLESENRCKICPMSRMIDNNTKVLLIRVGQMYYKTPAAFNREAMDMGISRYIQHIPKDFVIGETWVALAHAHAILEQLEFGKEPEQGYGIFSMFKPHSIEVLCDGTETAEEIDEYIERGLTPVFDVNIEAIQEEISA